MDETNAKDAASCPRRSFIKESGLMIAGGTIGGAIAVRKAVQGSRDKALKIAIVGCGRRARELADAVLSVDGESVELIGLADRFSSQTQSFYRSLKGRYPDSVGTHCLRSGGADCLSPILESDADLVYVATPPIDRPEYFRQLVHAGKHVFLEKPLAADVGGVLDMISTAQIAQQQGLSVHVGFQRRYDARYCDVIDRIREGAIGTPLFARTYCNAGPLRKPVRNIKESEEEFQRRNWNHFQWTGGDFLVEQHVAGLDVVRWALAQRPLVAQGQGGWGTFGVAEVQSQCSDRQGEVFDHHSVEYEFDGGAVVISQCRRVAKAWNDTSEHLHGTGGRADLSSGKIYSIDGSLVWQSDKPSSLKVSTIAQQRALLTSIRVGAAENQVASAAESTLMALLGHQATRTAKRVRMDKMLGQASHV